MRGIESRAGSKILNGYKPAFNAAAVERCVREGAIIIGKTSQDEFGFGGFNVNVGIDFKTPKNPFDAARVCGGSSGGAAGFTKKADEKGINHIALAESTGGSIVNPACFCGVFGLSPTYGLVSRHGLIDYANSMDKIGPIAATIKDIALMLEIIAGYDGRDSTSKKLADDNYDYTKYIGHRIKGKKIAVIKDFMKDLDEDTEKSVWNAVKKLEDEGVTYKETTLPFTAKYSLPAYYILAMAESSTNLARYCGMRYGRHEALKGNFNEYFSNVRTANFGKEAKRRIILGTFVRMADYRNAYYLKATMIRTKIIEEYKRILKRYDALLSPTVPFAAPRFTEIDKLTPLQNYMADIMTAPPNLAGLPHLNIPFGTVTKGGKNLPLGFMLTADHFHEKELIALGSAFD